MRHYLSRACASALSRAVPLERERREGIGLLVLRLDVGFCLTEDIWLDSADAVLCGDLPADKRDACSVSVVG